MGYNVADVIKFSLVLLSIMAEFCFCFWRGASFFPVKATSHLFWHSQIFLVLINYLKIQSKPRLGRPWQWGYEGVQVSANLRDPRDIQTQEPTWMGTALYAVITLPFRQSCTYLPSKHQTSVHFITRQVLGRDTTSSFHEQPGYPVNRGKKGFSLYRTTSGLNITVRSTLSFNSSSLWQPVL